MAKIFLFLNLILSSVLSYAQMVENGKEVNYRQTSTDSIVKQIIDVEREMVIERAEKFMYVSPRTVTSFSCPRSKGGSHDFFSEGPYWWPDPENAEGPYIRKDGFRNPDRFQSHDADLRYFSWIVGTQTSAYLLTGNEKYAKSAMLHLNAWFVDTATLMNPNMLYAQAIKGICTGRGIGIIDAVPLIDVAQSIMILEKSDFVSKRDIEYIKEWFKQFIIWLTSHPYGIEEMNEKNNHSTWFHAQLASYARLVDNEQVLQLCLDYYKEVLLPGQMAANGSFPHELERTKPYSYSLFNLDATTFLAWILSDKSFDVWNFSLNDGRGLKRGLEFIFPYFIDKNTWPYGKDVSNWEEQPNARQFMLFAALAGDKPEWFAIWKSKSEKNSNNESRLSQALKNPLLWIDLKNNNLKY